MIFTRNLIILIFLSQSYQTFGNSPQKKLFDQSFVHEIHLQFPMENFEDVLKENFNGDSFDFSSSTTSNETLYIPTSVTIDGTTLDSVGVRYKGFSSYNPNSSKNSFKLDFNEFISKQTYDGLKKLNLNNSTGDPSMLREYICYGLHHAMSVSASRVAFAKVYCNGEYHGLYQIVESVDKPFLKNRFNDADGNLFKNMGWSHLEPTNDHHDSIQDCFELKTKGDETNWEGFLNFIELLNNTTDEEFSTEIEKHFNVDLYLRVLAVDVATINWDSYLQHGRNYYLYEENTNQYLNWIPWDYNFALSGGWGFVADTTCNLYSDFFVFTNGTPTVKFYDNSYHNDAIEYQWDFGDGTYSIEVDPEHTFENSEPKHVCLSIFNENCADEICFEINPAENIYNCPSLQDPNFTHSIDKNFAHTIHIFDQCKNEWGEDCEDTYSWFNPEINSRNLGIDQRDNKGILIKRLLNIPEYYENYLSIFSDLLQNHFTVDKHKKIIEEQSLLIDEAVKEDSNSLFSYESFLSETKEGGLLKIISDRIDSLQLELEKLHYTPSQKQVKKGELTINEIIAINNSVKESIDLSNEYEDWIEIYNCTDTELNLHNCYLSDLKSDLKKWKFPTGTRIPAKGYLTLWADGHIHQPGLHTNFKLDGNGEAVYLSNQEGEIIDYIEFQEQQANISLARIPDGSGSFLKNTPSFDAKNPFPESFFNTNNEVIKAVIFPNPSTDIMNVVLEDENIENYTIDLLTSDGHAIFVNQPLEKHQALAITQLQEGFYFIRITNLNGDTVVKKILKLK